MLDDPKALTTANWDDIHQWLIFLWIYLPLVITFAFTLLLAHAIIPSLMATGQLPIAPDPFGVKVPFLSSAEEVRKFRFLLTAFAILVLIAAAIVMALAMKLSLRLGHFWDRFLI